MALDIRDFPEILREYASYKRTIQGCSEKTVTEYLTDLRCLEAARLLRESDHPVQEIAAECGIQDVNYFIKLFKRHTGFTPNRYREQLGKK